jgi:hypothetical protein
MPSFVTALLIANLCTLSFFHIPANAQQHRNDGEIVNAVDKYGPFTAKVEQFDIFFKKFNTNAAFQFSRIIFPLKTVMVDEDNKRIFKYVSKQEWKYTNSTKIKDIIITKYRVAKGEFSILLQIKDTGIHTTYSFITKEGKWYLSAIKDEST